jgi:drug/metabolite transporter (DMT)-like permease
MGRIRTPPNPKGVVILGVLLPSFSSILVRLSTAPSLIIAAYRLGFTVLLLLPVFLRFTSRDHAWVQPGVLLLCILSGCSLAFHFLTWFISLRHTSIAASTILVNTHPVIIILGSVLILHERIGKKPLLCIGATIVGSIVISLGDWGRGDGSIFGDLMALAGAVFVSLYILIGRKARRTLALPLYAFLVYGSSTVVLLLLALFTGTPLFSYGPRELLIFFLLALVCTIGGHTLFNWALKYVEPVFISTAILGEPLFASVLALLIFGEVPGLNVLLGGVLVLGGLFFFTRLTRRGERGRRRIDESSP